MNESENVQKAYTDELEQDAEDAMIEKLQENMLPEDLKHRLFHEGHICCQKCSINLNNGRRMVFFYQFYV